MLMTHLEHIERQCAARIGYKNSFKGGTASYIYCDQAHKYSLISSYILFTIPTMSYDSVRMQPSWALCFNLEAFFHVTVLPTYGSRMLNL